MNAVLGAMVFLLGNLTIYWHLPVLIVVISLVYSATRFDPWPQILQETYRWIWRMTAFLLSIAVILWVLSLWI